MHNSSYEEDIDQHSKSLEKYASTQQIEKLQNEKSQIEVELKKEKGEKDALLQKIKDLEKKQASKKIST